MSEPMVHDHDAHVQAWEWVLRWQGVHTAIAALQRVTAEEPAKQPSPAELVFAGRINMGRPRTILPKRDGRQGRPPKRTQYDDAIARRRKCFAYLGKKQRAADLGRRASLLDRPGVMDVVEAVLSDRSIPPRRRVAEIVSRYDEAELGPATDETSVRRALKRKGLI